MRRTYLFAGLLAIIFSSPLHSETPFDFWVLRFLQVGENPPCTISGPDYVCDNTSGITFTAPAGMATYAWSITGAGSIPGATNQQTVSVTSGNFLNDFTLTLTVTDVSNNSSTCNKQVFIFLQTPPANITVNPSPACLGVILNLSISAAASSTVSWTGEGVTNPNGNPSTTALPVTSGLKTYGVTVTTDQGCVNSGTANVTVGPVINLSTIVTNTCGSGSSGAINLTVTGGTPAFTYLWTGGATTEDRSNLPAGTYTVTVSDAGGCSKTISATVGSNPLPNVSFSFSPNDSVCVGTTTMITASGGTQYLWSTGATTQTLTVVASNSSNYTVTVTDGAGCSKVSFVQLTTFSLPFISPTIVQPTTCTSPDGSITLVTNGIYFNWSTPNGSGLVPTQQNQSGLTVGTYNVTVTNFNGCTATASYVLTGPGGCDCPTIGSLSANPSPACVNANVTLTASGLVNMGTTYGIVFKSFTAPTGDPYTGGTILATVTNNLLGGGGTSATATVSFASSGTKYLYAILTPVPSAPACRPSATTTLNVDIIPPSITCPANATVNANASCQGLIGSYSPASLSDNCNPSPTVTQSPVSSTLLTGHNATQTVTLTANDGNGNTSTCTLTVTLKDVTPPSITCPANATVNANASCQGTIGSYSAATLSDNCNPTPTVTQSPVASTVLTGHNATQTVTLTANDGNGNTSTCTLTVTLKDVTPPSISCPANATVNANASCQGQIGSYSAVTLSDNCNPSPTVTQSPAASTILTGHNATQTVTLTANDGNGNTSTCTLTVTLKDVTPPSITCPANATVAANASCQGTVGSYSAATLSDNCNPSSTVTQSPVASTTLTGHNATQTVTLTANDGNGNTSTCTLTVTLKDMTPPSITCPANTTVAANASCQGTVGSYSAASLSDNCNPSPTVTQSPVASTLLTGHNATQTVTLTANDGNGNTGTCTLTVTLKDVTPPTVTCQSNVTINADANCQGVLGLYTLTATDNCSASIGYGQTPPNGTIISGHNTTQIVTLSGSDDAGNPASCTLTVTLKDVTPPSITCPANATVNANASCQGTVGSYSASVLSDNCNPNPTVTQSPAASTLLTGHNAPQTVTLTANDGNGNTSTCTLTVTLKDVTPPSVTCPGNVTVNANASCQGTVGSYSAATLSDNCNPSPTVTQSPVASTLLTGHNATQTVTLTANDGNGNTSTCTLTVTLKDVTPPTITCPSNATVNANASCQGQVGSYSASALSDNCNPSPTVTQSPAASTLLTGHNATQTVTLTANDGNGNTSTCTLTVTLKDVTPPSISCPANTTVAANASCQGQIGSYSAATLSDNCNPSPTVTQSPAASTLLSGHNATQTVTLTANDGNGNTSTCTLTVTLKDVTKPTITCPANVTINANASCQGTINAFTPTALSDNCNPTPTLAQSPVAGSTISGHNTVQTVTLTATDVAGNTQTCTLTVTLKDVTPPTILCKTYIANLDATGNVSITPANVYQSGSDNCGVVNLVSVVASSFNCSNVGNNLVTLTANDGNGNTATCNATVTVRDVTPPVAKCQNVIANLGSNGTVTVSPASVNNGSSDNCNMTFTLTPNTFNCSQIGMQTVVLKVTDPGGNMATCSAKVTVRDITGPTAKCKNPTIFLDASGSATLSVAQVNNGSTDNCGIATMSIDRTLFSCAELGGTPWPVHLTLTDLNGNSATCLGYVTVKDAIAPMAVCEDVTVTIGSNGYAVVYGADLAFNSDDNCSVWSYTPVAKVYTKYNLGPNNLSITVKDWSGNASTCVSVVTVVLAGNGDFQPQGGNEGKGIGLYDLVIFPNPTSGEATMAFQLPAEQVFSFRIFDTSGRMIYSREDIGIEGENIMPLRMGDLAPGVYLIDFQSENWKVQKRLVLQR